MLLLLYSWLAVPYADATRRAGLHYALGHSQGPRLVVIGEKDDLITMDGMQVRTLITSSRRKMIGMLAVVLVPMAAA